MQSFSALPTRQQLMGPELCEEWTSESPRCERLATTRTGMGTRGRARIATAVAAPTDRQAPSPGTPQYMVSRAGTYTTPSAG